MKIDWKTEIVSWAILLLMFVLAVTAWPIAPERIPIHWGLSGRADGFAGKTEGLFLFPAVALFVYLLLLVVPLIDPRRKNYASFARVYAILMVTLLAFFAVIYCVMQLWIRGHSGAVSTVLPLALGALFMVLGNFMGKVRPNWFIGIRTPWTLSSSPVWVKTHRRAGWVFVAAGAVTIIADFVVHAWVYWALLAATLAGILYACVYSYVAWRAEQGERGQP